MMANVPGTGEASAEVVPCSQLTAGCKTVSAIGSGSAGCACLL